MTSHRFGGRRLPLILAVPIALVLGACGSGEGLTTSTATLAPAEPTPIAQATTAPDATEQPDAEPDDEPTEEPAGEPVADEDVFAVPDEITPGYVEVVMAVFDGFYTDVARGLMEAGGMSPGVEALFRAMYTPEEAEAWLELWRDITPEEVARLRAEPEPPRTEVVELIEARQDCVVARVQRDFDPLWEPGYEHNMNAEPWHIALRPRDPATDPEGVLPVPWQLSYDAQGGTPTC